MLRVIICLASVFAMSPVFAASLHVKAGKTHTIKADQSRLQLDELILEDGAKINFAADVQRWQVRAGKVSVGDDVQIIGVGESGTDGGSGSDTGGQAKNCEDGQSGSPGQQGGKGTAGVAITMDLKIASWGSLKVTSTGGVGGLGGPGGQGQQAGKIEKCSQTRGGAGGVGGDGGDGGNGGNVRIRYSYAAGSNISAPLDKFLEVENQGGQGGTSGKGGKGGEGSEGRYINMRTLSGSKKWVPGGKSGAEGSEGKPGRSGVDGQIVIEEDLAGLVDQRMQQQSAQVIQVQQQLEKALAEETARIAAEAQKKQTELAAQNQALLQQLEQFKSSAATTEASAQELNSQVSVLNQSQSTQLTKIDALEKEVAALKALLTEAQTSLQSKGGTEELQALQQSQKDAQAQLKATIDAQQITIEGQQATISQQQEAMTSLEKSMADQAELMKSKSELTKADVQKLIAAEIQKLKPAAPVKP